MIDEANRFRELAKLANQYKPTALEQLLELPENRCLNPLCYAHKYLVRNLNGKRYLEVEHLSLEDLFNSQGKE